MLADVRRIYRESLKSADSLANRFLFRPLAAVLVAFLAKTRVTPNQVTFASIAVFFLAVAAFVALPGMFGLLLGLLLVEMSYIVDCADGQLARVTGRTSAVGAMLDFLMDELKAFLLVGAVSTRLYLHSELGATALIVGLWTLATVACAIALTKFTRTPEYAEATGTELVKHGTSAGAASKRSSPLWPVEMVARLISQYPVTLPFFVVFDQMDIFLYAYGAVHVLYLGKTALIVLIRLGRFAPAGDDRSSQ